MKGDYIVDVGLLRAFIRGSLELYVSVRNNDFVVCLQSYVRSYAHDQSCYTSYILLHVSVLIEERLSIFK